MRWNVVELAENGRYAKLYRGFLLVMDGEQELGRIIIDEMNCLLLTAEQATLSKPVMVRLAENGVPIVICGKNYHPVALSLPYSAHHQSTRVINQQRVASEPLRKRLWQSLIKAKISHQKKVLSECQPEMETEVRQLDRLSGKVRSGDPENVEAQASRIYWQALLGKTFRRTTEGEDATNAALNYGYSVIRAACARAVVSAGLHASLGLHHSNQGNPFCLVDDVMEVYRPLIDREVFRVQPECSLNPENKRRLTRILQLSIRCNGKQTTVNSSMQSLASSLVQSYEHKVVLLQIPELITSEPKRKSQ